MKPSDIYNDVFINKLIEKNYIYDSETGVYSRTSYATVDGSHPTKNQLEKFLNGEYTLYMFTTEIQVLETNIVKNF